MVDFPSLSDFVGRAAELDIVERAITASDRRTYVFLVSGISGLGKTRLLQEVHVRYQDIPDVVFADRIDCYETSAHVPFSIESRLAANLGPFENFNLSFNNWYRSKFLSADLPVLTAAKAISDAFLSDYAQLAQTKRIVLRFDTVEVALRSELWARIIELIPHLDNTVLLLAGQRFGESSQALEERFAPKVVVRDLPLRGLDDQEVETFFEKLAQGLPLDSAMREKIRVLTDGKPVLLTLAIEWLRRSVPIKEIAALSLEAFRALTPEEAARLRQRVEQALVEGILRLTDSVDMAILQMAWIYRRFDLEILCNLMGFCEAEGRELLERLQGLPFTRVLPDGVCVLHDNVRDLVVKYDWPIVDPNGTQRLALDQMMVAYYKTLLEDQRRDMEALRQQLQPDAQIQPEQRRDVFERLINVETQRWIYMAERLFYMLRADPEGGVAYFAETFDEMSNFDRDSRELLISEITDQPEAWWARLSPGADFAINLRLAKAQAYVTQLQSAYENFQALLDHEKAVGIDRVDLLIQLGNVEVRLGSQIDAAEVHFKQAFDVSQSLNDAQGMVESEHALAWLQRLKGKWGEAASHYRSALQNVRLISDEKVRIKNQAWLENGLGYVELLLGHTQEAETHCLQALELWQRLHAALQLGNIYSTLGEVMTGQDRYAEALRYYHQALSIYQEQRTWEGQVIVYHQIAYSLWCAGDFQGAWDYMIKSRKLATEYAIAREFPAIFHRLGLLVLSDFQDFEEATPHFERGVQESRRQQNGQMLLENLVALVEIAARSYDYETMECRAQEMRAEIQTRQLNYPLLEGRLERILADVVFERAEYDKALAHYLKAIPLIAQHGGYARYKLSTELLFLGGRFEELEPSIARSWCRTMQETWESMDVSRTCPALLDFVNKISDKL